MGSAWPPWRAMTRLCCPWQCCQMVTCCLAQVRAAAPGVCVCCRTLPHRRQLLNAMPLTEVLNSPVIVEVLPCFACCNEFQKHAQAMRIPFCLFSSQSVRFAPLFLGHDHFSLFTCAHLHQKCLLRMTPPSSLSCALRAAVVSPCLLLQVTPPSSCGQA